VASSRSLSTAVQACSRSPCRFIAWCTTVRPRSVIATRTARRSVPSWCRSTKPSRCRVLIALETAALVAPVIRASWVGSASPMTHSDQMTVKERFRLLNPNLIEDQITVTDPVAFTKPWVVTKYFDKFTEPGVRAYDYGCAENNRNPIGADGFTLTLGSDGKPIDKPRP